MSLMGAVYLYKCAVYVPKYCVLAVESMLNMVMWIQYVQYCISILQIRPIGSSYILDRSCKNC